MSRIRRVGLTRDPPGGWPLDGILVGVATLRILRELCARGDWHRPWDLHLRTGVSPQGAADSLVRLEGAGLVKAGTRNVPDEATWYGLAHDHDLVPALGDLFATEARLVREWRRAALSARRSGTGSAARR